jgi:hypothetical protein
MLFKCLTALMLIILPSLNAKPSVAVCAIFQNEARFLDEWISYHHAMGVDHFRLYNNASKDDYAKVLQPWIARGVVELVQWPWQGKNEGAWGSIQIAAYNDAVAYLKKRYTWLVVIDTDEFIVTKKKSFTEYLSQDFSKCSGVFLNWQHFGTNGVWEAQSLTKQLTKRAVKNLPQNQIGKSIVKLKDLKRIGNAHLHLFKKGKHAVDTDHRRVIQRGIKGNKILTDKMFLAHFWCRDRKFMEEQKIPRRMKWNTRPEALRKSEAMMNQVKDFSCSDLWKSPQ